MSTPCLGSIRFSLLTIFDFALSVYLQTTSEPLFGTNWSGCGGVRSDRRILLGGGGTTVLSLRLLHPGLGRRWCPGCCSQSGKGLMQVIATQEMSKHIMEVGIITGAMKKTKAGRDKVSGLHARVKGSHGNISGRN